MFHGEGESGPDYKEFSVDGYSQWLGGLFEVGGAMFFKISVEKRLSRPRIYAYPMIELSDNDEQRVVRFQQIIGGRIYRSGTKSYRCWLKGVKAVALAQVMAPFSPSRGEIITAFENWENADTEERVAIAEEVSLSETGNYLTKDDYIPLVRLAPFVAGILDARAVFSMNEMLTPIGDRIHGWIYPRMDLTTINVPLIEALQERFGGSTEMITHEGENRTIFGQKYNVRHGSIRWTIGHRTYNDIIAFAGPFIKLRRLVD